MRAHTCIGATGEREGLGSLFVFFYDAHPVAAARGAEPTRGSGEVRRVALSIWRRERQSE